MPHGIKSLRSKILCNDLTQVMTLFIFCVSKIPQILRNNLTQGMRVSTLLDLDDNHGSGKSELNGKNYQNSASCYSELAKF